MSRDAGLRSQQDPDWVWGAGSLTSASSPPHPHLSPSLLPFRCVGFTSEQRGKQPQMMVLRCPLPIQSPFPVHSHNSFAAADASRFRVLQRVLLRQCKQWKWGGMFEQHRWRIRDLVVHSEFWSLPESTWPCCAFGGLGRTTNAAVLLILMSASPDQVA